jgi:hypothetical protein
MEVFDGIEMVAYGVGALALLLFVVFLGIRSSHRLAGPYGSLPASITCVVVVAVLVRDGRRRRWSPVSVAVAIAYALCLVALIIGEFVLA